MNQRWGGWSRLTRSTSRRGWFPAWIALAAALVLSIPAPGRAADWATLPPALRTALPDEVWESFPPELLEELSAADLAEYAEAYALGEFFTIATLEVEEARGPLKESEALALLQLYPGGPFSECRFIRRAKCLYGEQVFSSLRWRATANPDGTVNLALRYAAPGTTSLQPEALYNGIAGVLAGVRYEDRCVGGEDRTLAAGVQLSQEDLADPRVYVEWSDRTVGGGRDELNLAASVANDWRERLSDTPAYARMRVRVARLSGEYVWGDALRLGALDGDLALGAGTYLQDVYVYRGDPTNGGAAPRSDFDQQQAAGYASLEWRVDEVDHQTAPRQGYRLSVKAEGHGGGFDFSRLSVDYRRYWPAPNLLGLRSNSPCAEGCFDDVRWHFPAASVALQLQASAADGDVPYAEELTPGGANFCRGYSKSRHVGTKLLGARLEYRFALNATRDHELFVYCDNVGGGETFDNLEALNAVGLGGLFTMPFLDGVQAGAYFGSALDGSETQAALAFGYMF